MRCHSCNDSPCKVTFYKEILDMELGDIEDSIDNNSEKRNRLYNLYMFCEEGYDGDLDHHHIPKCIQSYVLSTFRNELDENNEDLLCTVRFSQGETIQVTISFDDIVPMSYVVDFVKQSPVQGWRVTLIGEYNTNASILCTNVIDWRKLSIYLRLNEYEYTYIHWELYNKNGELLGMKNKM